MKIPILKQNNILIATLQTALSDKNLNELQNDLSRKIIELRANAVIIDITELDVIDSFATRILKNIATILNLRGAKTILVGLQPDVAFAMVQLGLTLPGIQTALNLEEGIALLK